VPRTTKKAKRTKPSDYFSDIDAWPNEWMGVDEDLEIGRGLLGLFIPFIQHLIDLKSDEFSAVFLRFWRGADGRRSIVR
jgi:hypothetical protein